jgi:group I intron endonuclease
MRSIPKICVYRIVHLESGKCYIGSTVNRSDRWQLHRWHLNHGSHHSPKLQRAWNKYGASAFAFEVVEVVSNRENVVEREQFYLDSLQPQYNIAMVACRSMLGRKQSERFYEVMRAPRLQRRQETCLRGHPLSGENLYVSPKGRRGCRACTNANSRRHREIAAAARGRALEQHTRDRTHCPQGHAYSGDNLKMGNDGSRLCRECRRQAQRERYHRQHAELVAAKKASGTYRAPGWNLQELNARNKANRDPSNDSDQ